MAHETWDHAPNRARDDGTTDASAYFRCVAILDARIRPLKTPPEFLSRVAPLGGTFPPKQNGGNTDSGAVFPLLGSRLPVETRGTVNVVDFRSTGRCPCE